MLGSFCTVSWIQQSKPQPHIFLGRGSNQKISWNVVKEGPRRRIFKKIGFCCGTEIFQGLGNNFLGFSGLAHKPRLCLTNEINKVAILLLIFIFILCASLQLFTQPRQQGLSRDLSWEGPWMPSSLQDAGSDRGQTWMKCQWTSMWSFQLLGGLSEPTMTASKQKLINTLLSWRAYEVYILRLIIIQNPGRISFTKYCKIPC